MSVSIDVEETTKTEQLITQMGWSSRPSGNEENVAIEVCPICANSNWKFFIRIGGGDQDGLWQCFVCGEKGNYYQLRERLGVRTPGVASVREMAPGTPSPIPNADVLHKRLMTEEKFGDALDYLVADRGFSIETITKLKIGAEEYNSKVWIVYPYLDAAGKSVYFKARTLPPEKKDFRGPSGREAMLYNGVALRQGMEELFMVEGEADCVALINQGLENVVGIPGAGIKKAAWLERLDKLSPKTIYLCYDTDKVGQAAARDMAARIGLDKVKNLLLPAFEKADGSAGKDVNEYFASGHTLEDFDDLKANARPFDVEGVQSISDVLDELITSLEENGNEPEFTSPWPSLNKKVGGFERGEVCGVLADAKCGKTTMALNWVDWFAKTGKFNSLMFCGEVKPVRLVRKWVSATMQLDDTPGKSKINKEAVLEAAAVGAQYSKDLLFGYSQHNTPKEVFQTIRNAVRRYDVSVVCYDNLHLMSRSITNAAQEINVLSKQFKELAMELNIFLILILQPRKIQDGKMVCSNDINGSSAPSKDVDCNICLHRNRVAVLNTGSLPGRIETDENFESTLFVRADLTRNAPGGLCTLFMDGARSTVREFNHDELASAVVACPSGGIQVEEVAAI